MKKLLFISNSIYAKFAFIFLTIWWFLNSLTFGIIMRIMASSGFTRFSPEGAKQLHLEFDRIRMATKFTFLITSILGTVIILIAVRGIVKPIKRISKASKEVAKGNFDIEVKVQSEDEIGQLTSDFNLMAKELKSIEVLHKDFVSNVSHEFKTPITSIKGFAKLIRDGKITEDQLMEYSDIIVKESERLSLLSSNLLKLSELDSKVIREEASEFSLAEQIRKTILILQPQWEKKEIEFSIDMEETRITATDNLLQEVWLNLIQNAIKFSCPGGIVEIKLHKCGDKVKVVVADKGPGIDDEDKNRIFDRFYKGDKSRSRDGNGLGLVIAKRIVELSNGKIYVDSQKGKGTAFTVELFNGGV